MSFLAHITRDERIAALHISDTTVSAACFTRRSKELSDIAITRATLPEGTIVNGRLVNIAALTAALRQIGTRACRTKHVIVAIPHAPIFTKAVTLPEQVLKTLDGERVAEATRLALEWNVPFTANEGYFDTDIIRDGGNLISAIAAADMAPYFEALQAAGFKPVAVESEHAALARTLDPTTATVTSVSHATYTDIVAFRGDTLASAVSYPAEAFTTRQALTREVKRVSEFAAALFSKKPVVRTFDKLPFTEDIQAIITAREDATIAPLLGTLLRARIPRREDTATSLMPIGTELAYEYQKLDSFVRIVGIVTISTAVVLCIASAGMWSFMKQLRDSFPQTDLVRTTPESTTITAQKAEYARFSEVVRVAGERVDEETSYARLVAFLRRYTIDGIAIRDFSLKNAKSAIQITGVARSRAHLNAFRDALIAAPEVAEVKLPITGAELRGEVPFTLTYTLRTPTLWNTWRAPSTPAATAK